MTDEAMIERVRELIASASRILVLTGAGISTESGIPDFRGPQGVWTKNPEAEKMATLQTYRADPEVRKRAWQQRLALLSRNPEPNAGHRALLALEHGERLLALITQNIDGLHQQAGSNPALIIEIHGTVREVVCLACEQRGPIEAALARVREGELDPPCRRCGGILKSATISFGQSLNAGDLARSESAAKQCDLLLAIGSTLSVYPIAAIVPLAKRYGAQVVVVNGERTAMDNVADAVVRGAIGALLPRLVA